MVVGLGSSAARPRGRRFRRAWRGLTSNKLWVIWHWETRLLLRCFRAWSVAQTVGVSNSESAMQIGCVVVGVPPKHRRYNPAWKLVEADEMSYDGPSTRNVGVDVPGAELRGTSVLPACSSRACSATACVGRDGRGEALTAPVLAGRRHAGDATRSAPCLRVAYGEGIGRGRSGPTSIRRGGPPHSRRRREFRQVERLDTP